MKLTQRRSYVVSIKNKDINGTYCSLDNDGYYYRKYNEYLISLFFMLATYDLLCVSFIKSKFLLLIKG